MNFNRNYTQFINSNKILSISNFLKFKSWKIASFLICLALVPQSCKQYIDPETAEAKMLKQAQEMFKTTSSARVAGGSDNDLNMNEHKPDWNIKAFSKNSQKYDILNVLLKQNKDTYMELCFVYVDGKASMFVKGYTKSDNSLTIYSGEGKYIEKGEYFPQIGVYKRYWTKQDALKKGRMMDNPEYAYDTLLNEIVVIGYGNNSTSSSQYLPVVTMGNSGSANVNPNPNQGVVYYYPGTSSTGTTTTENSSKIIDNLTNSCFKTTLSSLINNDFKNKVQNILAKFNQSPTLNFTIKDEWMSNQLTNATTQGNVITLNTNALGNASQEYVAKVIYHEILHVYLNNTTAMADHQIMGNDYVIPMADALQSAFGINQADAIALAWSGLQASGCYIGLSQTEKNNIENTVVPQYKNYNNQYNHQYGKTCN